MKEQVLDIASVLEAINGKIDGLTMQLDTALGEIVVLKKDNAALRDRLTVYEIPKDSHNSSIPSSKESIKVQAEKASKLLATRSLRENSSRPTGGQKGHKGSTLEFTDEPDIVEQHKPYFCTRCGYDLSQIEGSVIGIRQSVDVPLPIRPIITEHQIIGKKCCCGHCSEANFPENVRPIQTTDRGAARLLWGNYESRYGRQYIVRYAEKIAISL